jgi:hypothetical protein
MSYLSLQFTTVSASLSFFCLYNPNVYFTRLTSDTTIAKRVFREERSSYNTRQPVSPTPTDRTLAVRISSNARLQTSSIKEANITSSKSLSSKINDYWILEMASCFGSARALVGIIVVSNEYNGKPLPEWPYGITVNSYPYGSCRSLQRFFWSL